MYLSLCIIVSVKGRIRDSMSDGNEANEEEFLEIKQEAEHLLRPSSTTTTMSPDTITSSAVSFATSSQSTDARSGLNVSSTLVQTFATTTNVLVSDTTSISTPCSVASSTTPGLRTVASSVVTPSQSSINKARRIIAGDFGNVSTNIIPWSSQGTQSNFTASLSYSDAMQGSPTVLKNTSTGVRTERPTTGNTQQTINTLISEVQPNCLVVVNDPNAFSAVQSMLSRGLATEPTSTASTDSAQVTSTTVNTTATGTSITSLPSEHEIQDTNITTTVVNVVQSINTKIPFSQF